MRSTGFFHTTLCKVIFVPCQPMPWTTLFVLKNGLSQSSTLSFVLKDILLAASTATICFRKPMEGPMDWHRSATRCWRSFEELCSMASRSCTSRECSGLSLETKEWYRRSASRCFTTQLLALLFDEFTIYSFRDCSSRWRRGYRCLGCWPLSPSWAWASAESESTPATWNRRWSHWSMFQSLSLSQLQYDGQTHGSRKIFAVATFGSHLEAVRPNLWWRKTQRACGHSRTHVCHWFGGRRICFGVTRREKSVHETHQGNSWLHFISSCFGSWADHFGCIRFTTSDTGDVGEDPSTAAILESASNIWKASSFKQADVSKCIRWWICKCMGYLVRAFTSNAIVLRSFYVCWKHSKL